VSDSRRSFASEVVDVARNKADKERVVSAGAVRKQSQNRSAEIMELRQKLGAVAGKKKVSREGLAKLLGVSPGTVRNWEVGGAISARMDERLRELMAKIERGNVEVPKPSEAPQRPKKTMATTALAKGDGMSPPKHGERLVFYANEVKVIGGLHDVRIRFSLVLPGEWSPTTVHEVVVPREIMVRVMGESREGAVEKRLLLDEPNEPA